MASFKFTADTKLVHTFSPFQPDDETARRQRVAQQSWPLLNNHKNLQICPFVIDDNTRTSRKMLNDTRELPLINDIFDAAFADPKTEVVLFTNTDVGFMRDPYPTITDQLAHFGGAVLQRVDFKKLHNPPADERGRRAAGIDGIVYCRDVWNYVRECIPPLFIGAEGFDFVLTVMCGLGKRSQKPDTAVLYHEDHNSPWKKTKKELIHSPVQRHNRTNCTRWASRYNLQYMLYKPTNGFLFKPMTFLR